MCRTNGVGVYSMAPPQKNTLGQLAGTAPVLIIKRPFTRLATRLLLPLTFPLIRLAKLLLLLWLLLTGIGVRREGAIAGGGLNFEFNQFIPHRIAAVTLGDGHQFPHAPARIESRRFVTLRLLRRLPLGSLHYNGLRFSGRRFSRLQFSGRQFSRVFFVHTLNTSSKSMIWRPGVGLCG